MASKLAVNALSPPRSSALPQQTTTLAANAESYHIFPHVDSFEEKLFREEAETSSKFVVNRKEKDFGEMNVQPSQHKQTYWELKGVQYDGIPFQLVATKTYDCHQGPDRNVHKKERYRAQKDKQEITGNTKSKRRDASKALKVAIAADPGTVESLVQFHTTFPSLEEHRNHPVIEPVAELREGIDPSVEELTEHNVSEDNCSDSTIVLMDVDVPSSCDPPEGKRSRKLKLRDECVSVFRQLIDCTFHLQDEDYMEELKNQMTQKLEECHQHKDNSQMIQCDRCEQWYHYRCEDQCQGRGRHCVTGPVHLSDMSPGLNLQDGGCTWGMTPLADDLLVGGCRKCCLSQATANDLPSKVFRSGTWCLGMHVRLTEDTCKVPYLVSRHVKLTEDTCKVLYLVPRHVRLTEDTCKVPYLVPRHVRLTEDTCKVPYLVPRHVRLTEDTCKVPYLVPRHVRLTEDTCKVPYLVPKECKTD
ncbi:hypothetical protein Bbelb_084530 [Branchiostoma belcheri]|nr:hypothetical protein Bbelb_084530 [Branchiostoma belcheri]